MAKPENTTWSWKKLLWIGAGLFVAYAIVTNPAEPKGAETDPAGIAALKEPASDSEVAGTAASPEPESITHKNTPAQTADAEQPSENSSSSPSVSPTSDAQPDVDAGSNLSGSLADGPTNDFSAGVSTDAELKQIAVLAATTRLEASVTGQSASYEEALQKLGTIPVKGRAPKTGYDRTEFGQAWADQDRNGCDTRNDILRRDLTGVKTTAKSNGCVVQLGTLSDKYTGQKIAFTRGENSQAVQIDHVVALHDAWQKGAQQLSKEARKNFGNDPLNLRATDGSANAQKGSSDAASWLPKNKGFRCEYVATIVDVKAKYALWMTSAEKTAIANILGGCSGELPQIKPIPSVKDSVAAPAPKPTKSPASKDTDSVGAVGSGKVSASGVAPASKTECPAHAPIKGNQGSNGWKYHVPGGRWYKNTHPERCFAEESHAAAAGYERAKNQ